MTHDPDDGDDSTWDPDFDSLDTTDVRTVFELNPDDEDEEVPHVAP